MSVDPTAIGFRIRGIGPPDLDLFPPSVRKQYWQWVTDAALKVKDRELAKGWDKDGAIHPLHPKTIKYRRSEVGPTHKHAPRGIPALNLSRVRVLLRGRAHDNSSELFWTFDWRTGKSFAVILDYWREDQGHDVFGISPGGLAAVQAQALNKWQAWKASYRGKVAMETTPPPVPRRSIPKQTIKWPVHKVKLPKVQTKGHMDLEHYTMWKGDEARIRRAIGNGTFSGFGRVNLSGEMWRPGNP